MNHRQRPTRQQEHVPSSIIITRSTIRSIQRNAFALLLSATQENFVRRHFNVFSVSMAFTSHSSDSHSVSVIRSGVDYYYYYYCCCCNATVWHQLNMEPNTYTTRKYAMENQLIVAWRVSVFISCTSTQIRYTYPRRHPKNVKE